MNKPVKPYFLSAFGGALALASVFSGSAQAARIGHCREEIAQKAFITINMDTGEKLFGENVEASTQPASMAKMMTMVLVHEAARAGVLSLDDMIRVTPQTTREVYPDRVSNWRDIKLKDAITAAALKSYNDLAAEMGKYVAKSYGLPATQEAFAGLMNNYAEILGMKDTHFANASGLPNDKNRTTVTDLGILLKHIYDHDPALAQTMGLPSARVRRRTIQTTNTLEKAPELRGKDVFAKTGATCSVGYGMAMGVMDKDIGIGVVIVGEETTWTRHDRVLELSLQALDLVRAQQQAQKVSIEIIPPAEDSVETLDKKILRDIQIQPVNQSALPALEP